MWINVPYSISWERGLLELRLEIAKPEAFYTLACRAPCDSRRIKAVMEVTVR
jgi:hypothetical protein